MIQVPSTLTAAAAFVSDFDDLLDIPEAVLLGEEQLEEEEEEELEWLSNKDAFPSLETSFELSGGGSSSGGVEKSSSSPVSAVSFMPPFQVPVRARTKGGRKRRRHVSPMPIMAPVAAPRRRCYGGEKRKCLHCEAEETPQWRAGPDGPKTLCNACGVRYKSGRLVPEYRPANSPTFSADMHSNSHRKIMEMRKGGSGRDGFV